jgi:hypothetical protein
MRPDEVNDPDVFAAWGDFNADMDPQDRYPTYAGYVEDQVQNYEHLLRVADPGAHPDGREAGEQEVQDLTYWHHKLTEEYDRLFTLCGACGQVHAKDRPAECDVAPGVRVMLEVWVTSSEAGGPDDPKALVRDMIREGEHVSLIDAYLSEE